MEQNGMFVEELGGKGETLVLVHGLGGSSNTWHPQAQVLKRDLRLVAYDLAGSGRSALSETSRSPAMCATCLTW